MIFLSPPPASLWRTELPNNFDALIAFWLQKPHALTDGLRQLGQLQLRVLHEGPQKLSTDEHWMLEGERDAWVREICMSLDGQAVVCARSFCTRSAADESWQSIRSLGAKPLADVLYVDSAVSRSNFCIHTQATLVDSLNALCANSFSAYTEHPIYARSSAFMRHGQRLVVTECFHPNFWSDFATLLPTL